jgi:hypothetical protein
VKTASTGQATTVGQVVTYTFAVSNTGNVTITNLTITEGSFSGHGYLSPVTCPNDRTVGPGETMRCTATYTIVGADLAADGTLSNTATASGEKPGGSLVTSDPSTASVAEVALVGAAAATPGQLAATGGDATVPAIAGLVALGLGLLVSAVVRKQWRRMN